MSSSSPCTKTSVRSNHVNTPNTPDSCQSHDICDCISSSRFGLVKALVFQSTEKCPVRSFAGGFTNSNLFPWKGVLQSKCVRDAWHSAGHALSPASATHDTSPPLPWVKVPLSYSCLPLSPCWLLSSVFSIHTVVLRKAD